MRAFFLSVAQWCAVFITLDMLYRCGIIVYFKLKVNKKVDFAIALSSMKLHIMMYVVSLAVLIYGQNEFYNYDYTSLILAYLIYKTPEILQETKTTVSYGMGMACSFMEGYLVHVIPNDGANFGGFVTNIEIYEAKHNIVFPVKRLFIVCTKSLFCPPDLSEFNKKNSQLPYLEAIRSLEDVEKDVAGVKNRSYRNSAYKLHRPGKAPVYLVVECATPLHTLYKARSRSQLREVLDNVDVKEVVNDFCSTLENLLKIPEYKDKCEIVYFDDKTEYLPSVLLEKIHALEPNFENIITKAKPK